MNRDPASFTFAQMTDSHLYYRVRAADADTADAFLRRAVAEVVARGVDFIVHTGDLAGYSVLGLEAGHRRFRSLWTELERTHRVPVYFVRGNHELGLADNLYRDIYGDSTWCRVHKGWAFVALDRYDQAYEHAPDYWDMNGATLDRLDTFLTGLPATMPKVLLLHENPVLCGNSSVPRPARERAWE
jgi:3',5'-cyclic AMP phosphodiesterase CpdA